MRDLTSFEEFWPHYLREHANPVTRTLHLTGTAIGLACAARGIMKRDPSWLIGGVAAAYGLAWAGHGLVEKNTPAAFTHPVWSLQADLKMLMLAATGELEGELRKAGVMSGQKSERQRISSA